MELSKEHHQRKSKRPVTVIDLFCGAGGLTRGLLDAGISVVAGYDNDVSCRYAYEANNEGALFKLKSVVDVTADELAKYYPKKGVRVLVGCAPCQPFSKYTQGSNTQRDSKWPLLYEFGRLANELRPEIISMENVPEIQRHEVFLAFVKNLKERDYHVSHTEAYCPDYGVPQRRKRLVLLASQFGPIDLMKIQKESDKLTVREAISHLPPLEAGEVAQDALHRSSRLSALNLKRIKASHQGGTWRDWPKDLVARCHQTEMGKNYPSVYGRMEWDRPSPTITTQFFGFGNGRFGHPEQDRALTLREGAILQSFPDYYKFVEKGQQVSFAKLGKMIGNAVPVRLGEAIGLSILEHLV